MFLLNTRTIVRNSLACRNLLLCSSQSQRRNYASSVQMDFVQYDSAETDHKAPPVIIMHGLLGSKQNWRGISKALESKLKRRIYAVDARNHGDSPHTSMHDYPGMAEDVVAFMKDRGIPKACLMGHSMGGRAMMFVALKYPELVDRGIIVDISPIDEPRNFTYMKDILQAMKSIKVPDNLTMSQARKEVEEQIKDFVGSKETVDFIMLNLRKRESGEFYWAPNIDGILTNIHKIGELMKHLPAGSSFSGPMTFLCGKHSNFVDPSSWPDIQKIFPNSEIHWLNAGHLVHFEQPTEFISIVMQFINRST